MFDEIEAYFRELTKEEVIMRDYYLASKNAETLKEFLNRPELAEI